MGVIIINGVQIPLKQRPFQSLIRRIYVRETISVPTNTHVNVPVRMPLVNWHSPNCDWLTQAKQIKPGVFIARTLLPDLDCFAVKFINISGSKQTFRNGLCLGDAEPRVGRKLATAAPPPLITVNATSRTNDELSRHDGMVRDDHRDGADELTSHLGYGRVGSLEPDSSMALDHRGRLERVSYSETDMTEPLCNRHRMFRPWELTNYDRQDVPQDTNITRAISVVTATLPAVSDKSAKFNLGFQREQSNVNADSDISCTIEPAAVSVNSLDSNVSGEFDYLKPIFDSLPAELTVNQRREVKDLLFRNADVFEQASIRPRRDLLTFRIDTGDHRSIAQPLRQHPRAHLDLIDETVDKMMQAGIIEPAASPWSSNNVLVLSCTDLSCDLYSCVSHRNTCARRT